MIRQSNGAEYVIVYNGEIYNADELRATLARTGCRFETTSDTEVILCAYMEYGRDFVKKLNGINIVLFFSPDDYFDFFS